VAVALNLILKAQVLVMKRADRSIPLNVVDAEDILIFDGHFLQVYCFIESMVASFMCKSRVIWIYNTL
jgi:hypothetical protein